MDYKSTTATFSDNQKEKIKSFFKNKLGETIQFWFDKIHIEENKVLLTKRQLKKLEKYERDGKEVRIEFSCNQFRENHGGGLLKKILEFVENNILYDIKLTRNIRKRGAPLNKELVVYDNRTNK